MANYMCMYICVYTHTLTFEKVFGRKLVLTKYIQEHFRMRYMF